MNQPTSPDRPGAFVGALRTAASAGGGGILAVAVLLGAGQGLGLLLHASAGTSGLAWAKAGLLASLAAVRAEVVVTFRAPPGGVVFLPSSESASHLVPMALTLLFLWLAVRAGRRAARSWPEAPILARIAVAAAGAGAPVAVVAALAAGLASLSFPGIRLTLAVDTASAAVWAGSLAAGAAAVGAALESGPDRVWAAVLRGGVTGYLWALGLLVVGVLVIATLEPDVTRRYVDDLRSNGATGAAVFGAHVLALPAQSALLLVPASGACLDLLVSGATEARLCPWEIRATGPLGDTVLLAGPLQLSPSAWLLLVVPPIGAFLGGRRAGARAEAVPGLVRGAASGAVFAMLALVGAAFAAPRVVFPSVLGWLPLEFDVWSLRAALLVGAWGIVAGGIGGWIAGRTYEAPGVPSPTSA